MSESTIRVNTRISQESNSWLDDRSLKTGISKSSLISMAVETYITQMRSINALELSQGTLKQLFEKLESIEKRLSSESEMQ